jgi:hypothetical protein
MNSRESAELNGCVEFRQFGAWFDLIDASVLIGKNYDLFACLFGVTNFAGFRPLFPGRGLPEDCGDALKQKFESAPGVYFGASWVSYEELKIAHSRIRGGRGWDRVVSS